ncbi:copper amine oxidase N-terminal domain-containing protein [Bacillus aquiflavi]|uniref:Copper amine oxidase N-terminal domain-containing protein n=1 Tax=Bacillus aquiflavi TaxID=2672567 RepID=A0A6B3W169_9BACI|nr:copper amine oxidase N-terminal domain-containing protein [Bacillus aquiflavi]MBA4537360.1 copper amine oxidase N-terminal domain-containing protein [Bacillus aquiflavi]NEY81616.1 copper amine oxidase N-terminal domain-containing protein [Bacillus aquiflavi]UAC49184.1 copper amine oxidase N-terminal domain-containing protein [Bacillus aquiflavi]
MKKWSFILSAFLLIGFIIPGTNDVMADDDGDDEYEEYNEYEMDDDDDEHEDDGHNDHEYRENNSNQPTHFWNLWSRDVTVQKGTLPFTEPTLSIFKNAEGVEKELFVIPNEGELLVPAKEIAELLGSQTTFYRNSKIVLMEKDNYELIVKAGTNAAYENKLKTPMPAKAMFYEQSVYVPISVVTNALGYRAEWDDQGKSFLISKLTY